MGFFDSFSKVFETGKLPGLDASKDVVKIATSRKRREGILKFGSVLPSDQAGIVPLILLSKKDKELSGALKRAGGEGAALVAGSTLGPVSHIFKKPRETTPPTPPPAPATGAGRGEAQRAARERALSEAEARRSRKGIRTSPLGLIGPGAATGQKKLTGE
jgi:hypothetical protein